MKKVWIVRGISGAGKSTYIKTMGNVFVCSADHFFIGRDGQYRWDKNKLKNAHNSCMRRFIEAIQDNVERIVVDNTNTTITEIAPYVSVASAYGYETEILTLCIDPLIASARNIHGLSEDTIRHQHYKLQEYLKHCPLYWKHTYIDNTPK